ncbi:MAG: hypothetical protein AAF850_08475 [Pseudomonadota bacterium]
MALEKGVIDPSRKDTYPMYIGWAKAPTVDRRFLLAAMPALAAAGAAGSYAASSQLSDPGEGAWLTGATHTIIGYLAAKPYPMIRMPDKSAPFGMRTILIVAQGKCTSSLMLERLDGALVEASGVLIQRKERQMLEVPLALDDWLTPAPSVAAEAASFVTPTEESFGAMRLRGMVMDTKCFFGVMRPARGRTHKACASLCIRGGIPPSYWVRDTSGRERILLMTDDRGAPLGEDILPMVAEASEADGELVRVGDILQFRANAGRYRLVKL